MLASPWGSLGGFMPEVLLALDFVPFIDFMLKYFQFGAILVPAGTTRSGTYNRHSCTACSGLEVLVHFVLPLSVPPGEGYQP